MAIVNDIKILVSSSRLFADAEKLEKVKSGKVHKRGRRSKDGIKIGQGGTLDPLADGVLGEDYSQSPSPWFVGGSLINE